MQERFLPHDHGQQIEHQLDAMPKEEDFQIVSDLFKLLCDRSRVRIFWLLCHCEECVINLSSIVGMSSRLPPPAPAEKQRADCQPPGGQGGLLPRSGHRAGAAAAPHDRKDGGDCLSG